MARPPGTTRSGAAWQKRSSQRESGSYRAPRTWAERRAAELDLCRRAWEKASHPRAIPAALHACTSQADDDPGVPPPPWLCKAVAGWIEMARRRPGDLHRIWQRHLRDLEDFTRADVFEEAREQGMTRARAAEYAARQAHVAISGAAILRSVGKVARANRTCPERYADLGAYRWIAQDQRDVHLLLLGEFRVEHLRWLACQFLVEWLAHGPRLVAELTEAFPRCIHAAAGSLTADEQAEALSFARRKLRVRRISGNRWALPRTTHHSAPLPR